MGLFPTTTHLVSTRSLAVQVRFGFFLVQLLIQAWWVVQLVKSALQ